MFAIVKCDSVFPLTPYLNGSQMLAAHSGQRLFGCTKIKIEKQVYMIPGAYLFLNNVIFVG